MLMSVMRYALAVIGYRDGHQHVEIAAAFSGSAFSAFWYRAEFEVILKSVEF